MSSLLFDVMSNNNNKRRYVSPPPSETVFRIVCPAAKTDDLVALSGDGVKILVDDHAGDVSSSGDRTVVIVGDSEQHAKSSSEESAAQIALIRVFERMVEEEDRSSNSTVACRLVAPTFQVGCVLGRGGKIVEKLRQESGAQIRVSPKDQSPLPPSGNEYIQVFFSNPYSLD